MTKLSTLLVASFAVLLVWAPARAQDKFNPPVPRIAIIDVQRIMHESTAAKSARNQMEAIARKEQGGLAEEEKKLRARDQELAQQRALLTPDVFAQRQRDLQADIANLQRRSRDLRQTIDQSYQKTMDQIQLVLLDEVRKLSTEHKVNLVLPRSQIVIAVDDYDLTTPALERLNKRLPSVKLKLTKTEPKAKSK